MSTGCTPFTSSFPAEKLDDVTIELPLGWQVASSPNPQNQDAKIIGYSLKVENDAGTVHWTRKLNVYVLYLEPKYYPSLRNFFQGVRKGDDEQVVLQPATATTVD